MRRAVIGSMGLVLLGIGLALIGCTMSDVAVRSPGVYDSVAFPGEASLRTSLGSAPAAARTGLDMPESSLPGRDEELWVIRKAEQPAMAQADDQIPGMGSLLAKRPGNAENVPVPLKHTDVKASIAGYIASVDVTQQYQNPYDTKIEATYVFPLPHNAAVNDFLMTIGDRKIRGIIRERQEAERIYQEAKAQGYVASLLTQERPNIFTQAVANIEPGKQIDISIRYFHTLSYADGWFEFVFPMVVGPRFNPRGSTEGVGAVAREARGVSGQKTEVPYLRPNERSGHDIALTVDLDAGVRLENLLCTSHQVNIKTLEGSQASVTLSAADGIPNKDFVLRYQVAGKTPKSAVVAHRDERGGYFTLMLLPPQDLSNLPRKPLEMVFTLDVSGSMNGRPIEQAKSAIRYALEHMDQRDTFQVIRFFDRADRLFDRPKPVTPGNVKAALSFINGTDAGGGTMMIEGIRESLNFPRDENRLRLVTFLTDGFIGNEAEILREIHDNLGPSRIFSFGVGSSTNRYLLDHMAKMGQGAAAYLSPHDKAEEVMGPYFERISHPAMTDIVIDWGGMNVSEAYPQRMPDLFVGRPVILTGRFNGNGNTAIKIKGIVGGEAREMVMPIKLDEPTAAHKAIPTIWARGKITDLCDRSTWEANEQLPGQIKGLALEYGLMSPYTAFLAVDSTAKTAGEYGMGVSVPVPVPEGVKYETTVQEKAGAAGEGVERQ